VSDDFNIDTYRKTSVLLYMYHSHLKLTTQSQILFELFRSLSADLTKPNPIMTRLVFVVFKIITLCIPSQNGLFASFQHD
jgi:hypothetical protein